MWLFDEASFEKMGNLMAANKLKLLGMHDELSTFLAHINVYRRTASQTLMNCPFVSLIVESLGNVQLESTQYVCIVYSPVAIVGFSNFLHLVIISMIHTTVILVCTCSLS